MGSQIGLFGPFYGFHGPEWESFSVAPPALDPWLPLAVRTTTGAPAGGSLEVLYGASDPPYAPVPPDLGRRAEQAGILENEIQVAWRLSVPGPLQSNVEGTTWSTSLVAD